MNDKESANQEGFEFEFQVEIETESSEKYLKMIKINEAMKLV